MTATSQGPLKHLVGFARRVRRRLGLARSARSPRKLESLQVLRRRGIPVDAVVDVGVLHGTFELIDSFPDVHHFLFEPVEECAHIISQAYSKLDYTLVPKAVGSGDGVTSMRILGEPGSLNSSAHIKVVGENGSERSVEVISLDSCFDQFETVENCLLKIDTDGSEIGVLKGSCTFLSRCAVVIVEATKDNIIEVMSFMSDRKFQIFDMVEPCYFDDALWQVDLIFIRKELYDDKFGTILGNDFDSSKYQIFT
ncbi:FkbM family methyltransferase [Maricaulis maris]|uniref:FkbM family methyltransferase n=1 Tax=Maricaulis maris TaxID=74318 RepID=A0A495D5A8_9PROT|nr:FkbM family methyltransferase [Maricaulis maris]RKQ96200.1 FkbM family methyltransferase [Maricaulis maris]